MAMSLFDSAEMYAGGAPRRTLADAGARSVVWAPWDGMMGIGEADGTWKIKGEVDVSMHIIADIQPMAATEHLIRVSGPRSAVAAMKRERINIKYYFSYVHFSFSFSFSFWSDGREIDRS